MSVKDTNPKDAVGIKKVPMSTVPVPVMMEVGLAMLEGALNYGRHNYRETGVRASVYYDATWRHLGAWWEGEDIDPKSQLSHITKAIACLTVLRDSMIRKNWKDDRPPQVDAGWIEEYNKHAAYLIDKFPNPPEPYTNDKPVEVPNSIIDFTFPDVDLNVVYTGTPVQEGDCLTSATGPIVRNNGIKSRK
jgi:hypothetical protein